MSVNSIVEKSFTTMTAGSVGGVGDNILGIELKAFTEPQQGVSHVAFEVVASGANVSSEGLAASIKRSLNGEVELVPGSARIASRSGERMTILASVIPSVVARAVNGDGVPENFVCVARNIFMDENDRKTWRLVEAEGQGSPMLVRDSSVETDKDMAELLASCVPATAPYSKEAKALTALAHSTVRNLQTGNLASFVGEGRGHEIGFVLTAGSTDNTVKVLMFADQPVVREVALASFVEVHDLGQALPQMALPNASEVMVAGHSPSINNMIDYYSRVFSMNKQYLTMFLSRLRSHAFV